MSDSRNEPAAATVKFTDLFTETLRLLPETVCVADGELLDDEGGYFRRSGFKNLLACGR